LERRLKVLFIVLIIAIASAMPGVALQLNDPLAQGPGSIHPAFSRVLFLEHYLEANGTVVKGEAPFRSVNFPTYWYNQNTGHLNGQIDFRINNSLMMIFGDVLTLKGNFGAGTGNKLYGIYSLPAKTDQAVIYSIDMSGNIGLYVNDETVVLKPGETYRYSENETLRSGKALIDVVYNHTYVNHGYIDKNNISASLVNH